MRNESGREGTVTKTEGDSEGRDAEKTSRDSSKKGTASRVTWFTSKLCGKSTNSKNVKLKGVKGYVSPQSLREGSLARPRSVYARGRRF